MTEWYEVREKARGLWHDSNLKYEHISAYMCIGLRDLIKIELENHTHFPMTVREPIIKTNSKSTINSFRIEVDGSYFKKREAITFNSDGFIGFSGWADNGNSKPFIIAFEKWVKWVKSL